jgi:hypothetical protein
LVRPVQGGADLLGDGQGELDPLAGRAFDGELVAETAPGHEFGDQIGQAPGERGAIEGPLAALNDGQDVGVSQPGDQLGFLPEAGTEDLVEGAGAGDDLDGDVALT